MSPSLIPLRPTVLTRDGSVATRSYSLIEEIGRGAAGTVWRGRAAATGHEYAIKILHEDHEAPKAVARFLQERAILLRLRHENLVAVHDLLTTVDGHLALVLDLVAGGSLRELLRQRSTLPPAEAAALLAQVAAGLAAAHDAGVVHRDLKPDNILLATSHDGGTRVRLTDFGIARVLDGPRMTTTGAVLGTPNYMAPEVIEGEPATPGADVYALGIILYELLAGRPPFDDECDTAILLHHTRALARPVTGMPARFWALIQACLHRDPSRRPAAVTLRTTLGRLADESTGIAAIPYPRGGDGAAKTYRLKDSLAAPAPAVPAPQPRSPRRAVTPALAAVTVLALAIGGYTTAHLDRHFPGRAPARTGPRVDTPAPAAAPSAAPASNPPPPSAAPSVSRSPGQEPPARTRNTRPPDGLGVPEDLGSWTCASDRWPLAHPMLVRACHKLGVTVMIIGTLKALPGIQAEPWLEIQNADTQTIVAGPFHCPRMTFTDTSLERSCGPFAVSLPRQGRYRIVARWKYSGAGFIPGGVIYGDAFMW